MANIGERVKIKSYLEPGKIGQEATYIAVVLERYPTNGINPCWFDYSCTDIAGNVRFTLGYQMEPI